MTGLSLRFFQLSSFVINGLAWLRAVITEPISNQLVIKSASAAITKHTFILMQKSDIIENLFGCYRRVLKVRSGDNSLFYGQERPHPPRCSGGRRRVALDIDLDRCEQAFGFMP